MEKARGPEKEQETEKVWVLATGPEKAREQATARVPVQEKARVPERAPVLGRGTVPETGPARVQATEPVPAQARCSWVTEPVSRCRRRMRRASA